MNNVAYWLLVERKENWKIDKEEGFLRFGLSERKKKLADQIKKGDLLIFYIGSGISMLSDIREATEDGVKKLGRAGNYDEAFPISLSTRPYLTLSQDRWVPFKGLIDKLSFTSGKKDLRQIMRLSLRRLSKDDGMMLLNTMKQASQ